ncbi:hypothetical protein B0H19DRAFT_196945, partial [Mycena capillaripes]
MTVNNFGSQETNSTERTKFLDWLSPINFFLRHADIKQVRQAGTGEWLLVHPHFKAWESDSGSTLWCRGIPGAGKTVLASKVVDYLYEKFENQNTGIACMYLNHKEAEDQTPAMLLSGLWRQLVYDRNIGPFVKGLYKKHKEQQTKPTLEEVFSVLQQVITEFSQVYIVVDAVDEYAPTQRRILLKHLRMMGPTVNLMITSRPHITPDPSLPNLNTINICAKEQDLRTYIDAQIQLSENLDTLVQATQGNLQEEICSKITRTVDGMFLLARLHIESLSTKDTVKKVREALKVLPKTLNASYDNVIERIDKQHEEAQNRAYSALTWVVNAKRPLKVLELQTALAIEPDSKSLNADNMVPVNIILSVCAGLVVVDEKLSVVRLVHYTTQEYLDNILYKKCPHPQTEIACSLLTYLAFEETRSEVKNHRFIEYSFKDFPLLQYSGYYCLMHAAGPPENALESMILEFLAWAAQKKKNRLLPWDSPPWDYAYWPAEPSVLWIVVAANLINTAKLLLQGATDLYCLDSPEIIVASYYGHLEMVQLLVEHGANMNAQGGG